MELAVQSQCFLPIHMNVVLQLQTGWMPCSTLEHAVASGIIFPLGISVLIYDYCKEGRAGTMIRR